MHVVSKVTDLVNKLCNSVVCEGNSDEDYLLLPNIHKNVMKTYPVSYYACVVTYVYYYFIPVLHVETETVAILQELVFFLFIMSIVKF